ncbi:MAG: hypothetical protein ACYCST_14950 [Acidimicrobiales bacterium]
MDTLAIIRELQADPGLRAQLRAVLLSEEILQLPQLVADNGRDIRELREVVAALERRQESLERGQESLVKGQESLERGQESLVKGQESLVKGQESLERRQDSLERGQESLREEVGRLSEIVGGTVEADATSVVVTVLERRGWTVHGVPEPVAVNGEIDVLGRATTAEGKDVAVLVEAKTRLRPADVRRFAAGLDRLVAAAGIVGSYVPYVYGLRVYFGVEETSRDLGLGVLCPDGERVPGALRSV